ncbi:hypothetical protein [Crossiella sp. CA198]|uniref:hypothetical protein n=1 Tax=Crossiella sp. CA198 TaxID=3455607 RepID=UPI003F8D5D26
MSERSGVNLALALLFAALTASLFHPILGLLAVLVLVVQLFRSLTRSARPWKG